MLGNDLFRVESNVDLSKEMYKSLILFYNPLIGNDAHYLYEFLVIKGTNFSFEELNKVLNSLNISIDSFEKSIEKLNQYRLVNTLKKKDEDQYVFVLNNPLTPYEFIKNDLFVREFILKTSGLYYQSLISDLRYENNYKDYEDISTKYDASALVSWNSKNESFLRPTNKGIYDFNTFFDINTFLKDMTTTLFPLKYRTIENLKEIATLADLYNISYEKMRSYIPQVSKTDTNNFDLNLLKYLCQNANSEYRFVEEGIYDIPCQLFLLNKQEGKDVSPYDKKIIYNLANDYKLKPSVINVLIEHTLRSCSNHLLENFIYPVASDLHRNNVVTAKDALSFLDYHKNKEGVREQEETYDSIDNPEFTDERRRELFRYRKGQDE